MSKRKIGPMRRAQLVSTFGVGSIVDFPKNLSAMIAGLDEWDVPNFEDYIVDDKRLAERLGVKCFLAPPPAPERNAGQGAYIPTVRFPLWHFCNRCQTLLKGVWNQTVPKCQSPLRKKEPCAELPPRSSKRVPPIPMRFVVACANGHIDDFPWEEWVHSSKESGGSPCSSPLLTIRHSSTRSGLGGIMIKCHSCGKYRSMAGSSSPTGLKGFVCSGNRPWLGPEGKQVCNATPRMLQKGGSNIYYPQTCSSILIPPFSGGGATSREDVKIEKLLNDPKIWQKITSSVGEDGSPQKDRLSMLADAYNVDEQKLCDTVETKLSGLKMDGTETEESNYRLAEYRALCSGSSSDEGLFSMKEPGVSKYAPEIAKFFDKISLVEKLTETRAFTGFSRVIPPVAVKYATSVERGLSLEPVDWLPANQTKGEGIFLKLNEDRLDRWVNSSPIIRRRVAQFDERRARVAREGGQEFVALPAKFYVIHTFCHLLIRRLSFSAGYGTASIRERLYCDEGGGNNMAGLLLYTAAGDCEGTLGGLVNQALPGKFENLVASAILDSLWCATDPICIESAGQGIDSLNRAACYACSLLPETSCECGNRLLDRVMVLGEPERPELGYFGELVVELQDQAIS